MTWDAAADLLLPACPPPATAMNRLRHRRIAACSSPVGSKPIILRRSADAGPSLHGSAIGGGAWRVVTIGQNPLKHKAPIRRTRAHSNWGHEGAREIGYYATTNAILLVTRRV